MRIDSLRVENFRCFVKEEWEFAPGFNVFIGDNGAGKTAILNALAVAINSNFPNKEEIFPRILEIDDICFSVSAINEYLILKRFYPMLINCSERIINSDNEVIIINRNIVFEENSFLSNDDSYDRKFLTWKDGSEVGGLNALIENEDLILPLIVFYSAGNLWHKVDNDISDLIKPIARNIGYKNCLVAAPDSKFLYNWLACSQSGESLEIMQGVRAAVIACLGDDWEQIWYDIDLDEIMAKRKDGTQLPARLLSDGQRSILAMGLDMAYRAAVLNPHLAGKAAQETPGVVLIDELDLHLHPNWQRTIVPNLRRAFPKVQFFVTTHSPIILQGLDPKLDRVIRLNAPSPSTYPPVEDFIDKPLEDILMDVQDYPAFQMSERRQAMIAAAEKYYTVLKQAEKASDEELERLKQEMDELALPFHDNPAYIAFLNMERQAALGERN